MTKPPKIAKARATDDAPAIPQETHEQFARGEIHEADYRWLIGEDAYWDGKQLLVPYKYKSAAHYWNGSDTVCKAISSGGISMSRYHVAKAKGFRGRICRNCISAASQ
jgi:hypothetical protein